MRKTFIWQRPDWPNFRWNSGALLSDLGGARQALGGFLTQMGLLGFGDQEEIQVETLTTEALETSEIEGESLSRPDVRASVARRLGVAGAATGITDPKAQGIVDVTLDATSHYKTELTEQRLLQWHSLLFPTIGRRTPQILVGQWRDDAVGPMQVLSGHSAAVQVHFEAPAAADVPREMTRFLAWFEDTKTYDWLITSAIAHFYFLTIHPFDDGNGRIARAIADMALSRDERSDRRYFSMSQQIRREKGAYYDVVEATQAGDLDITEWLRWFLGCYTRSIESAQSGVAKVLHSARFWAIHANATVSARQRTVVNRLLTGFDGLLTAKKYAKLTDVSEDTAQRDILDLIRKGFLVSDRAARNVSYILSALPDAIRPGNG